MLRRLKLHASLPALALGASLAMTAGAMAQQKPARECLQKDIAAITTIEEHGEAGDVPGERLGKAHMTMLDAREVCAEGRVGEALALYQTILDLGPVVASLNRIRP